MSPDHRADPHPTAAGSPVTDARQTLFEPFTLAGITLRNRVVMAPMTTWFSNADGTVSDEEVAYYRRRVHGVGLVITGCTRVS